jgi:hypothetical protein
VISTAGNVVFTGGSSNDLVALDATTGQALWHSILNTSISNGPITYELDGRQYVVAAAGDTVWTFVMNTPAIRSDLEPPRQSTTMIHRSVTRDQKQSFLALVSFVKSWSACDRGRLHESHVLLL